MKRWISLLFIYVLVSGSHVRIYEGQSEETVLRLISEEGKTANLISEKEYNTFIENHKDKEVDPERERAKTDLKSIENSDTERLNALIKYLGI